MKRKLEWDMSFAVVSVFLTLYYISWRLWQTDLSVWDMPGHILSITFYRDHLWPWISGWSPHGFGGYPAGTFYPSLFEWIAGGFSKVFPLLAVTKCLLCLSLFLIPISTYLFLRGLGLVPRTSVLATLCLVIVIFIPEHRNSLGGTLFGLVRGGLVSAQFSFSLFFFYLWSLRIAMDRPFHLFLSSMFLAALIMGHGFIALMAVVNSLAYFIFCLSQKPKAFKFYAAHVLMVAFLSAGWVGPFLYFKNYAEGDFLNVQGFDTFLYGQPLTYFIFMFLFFLTLVCILKKKIKQIEPLFALFASTLFFYLALKECPHTFQYLLGNLPVHPYRLLIFIYAYMALLIGCFLSTLKWQKTAVTIAALAVCIVGVVKDKKFQDHQSRHFDVGSGLNKQKRGLVIMNKKSRLVSNYRSPHQLMFDFLNNGYPVLNGLFAESSAVSPFVMGYLREVAGAPFTWFDGGVKASPQSIETHSSLLGVDWVITETAFPATEGLRHLAYKTLGTNLVFELDGEPLVVPFTIYFLKNEPAEFFKVPPVFYNGKNWKDFLIAWWGNRSMENIPVLGPDENQAFTPSLPAETVQLRMPSLEQLEIDAHSKTDHWIYVKYPYFPNWHAFKDGREILLRRASINFMALFSHGHIEISYRRSRFEIICHFISLASFVLFMTAMGFFLIKEKIEESKNQKKLMG